MRISAWTPSRRGFLVSAGALGALATGGRLWGPGRAGAEADDPQEIPGTFMDIPGAPHVASPDPGNEPSTIFNFDGVVAITRILGTGTAHGEAPATMSFDCDMRLMIGRYLGDDGVIRSGTFGFV